MKAGTLTRVTLSLAVAFAAPTAALALDEGRLTPTSAQVVPAEEQEFQAAMTVWNAHRYPEGTRLLRRFAAKHPDSRWAAEANLHVGCYNFYAERYDDARRVLQAVLAKHPNSNVAAKARIRLGNVAERTGNLREAMAQYTQVLQMNPTRNQFKYANYRARILIRREHHRQAMIDCGPVALAACLRALGREFEAKEARALTPGDNGISLAELQVQAGALGVQAQAVQMPFRQLRTASLPVLAHVRPNHFAAVLAVNGDTADLDDSLRGKHEIPLADLERKWTGRALVFDASADFEQLSAAEALETLGGCCGQADEDECLGSGAKCECQHGSGDGGGGGGGC